jgi:hypothetical protein
MKPNVMMMMSTQSKKSAKLNTVRVEPVDNWHGAWKKVVEMVRKHGDERTLKLDDEGWLSTRQVLMAVFVGETPVAHISFSVSPTESGCVEATLDGYSIDRKFCGRGLEAKLHQATVKRTKALGCVKLSNWALPTAYYPPRQSWAMQSLHGV